MILKLRKTKIIKNSGQWKNVFAQSRRHLINPFYTTLNLTLHVFIFWPPFTSFGTKIALNRMIKWLYIKVNKLPDTLENYAVYIC